MAGDKDGAKAAAQKFYLAFDWVLKGRPDAMGEAWHQANFVTSLHPFGTWARGWGEVWASWQELATSFSAYRGHAARTDRISGIHELVVARSGDSAHTIAVIKLLLYLPQRELTLSLNCSSLLQCHGGAWKVVHHHFDQAPPHFLASLRRMIKHGE